MINESLQDENSNPKKKVLMIVVVGFTGGDRNRICQKISRYLNWIGIKTQVLPIKTNIEDYFLQSLSFILCGSDVTIFNSAIASVEKRNSMKNIVGKFENVQLMFVEVICVYPTLSDQVTGEQTEYEVITAEEMNKNVVTPLKKTGKDVKVFHENDPIQTKIVNFLEKISLQSNTVFFSLHGQSKYNVDHKLGGDSNLSERGVSYSKALASVFGAEKYKNMVVWTSNKVRTIQTASRLKHSKVQIGALDEINAGKYEGYTYDQIEKYHSEEFNKICADIFSYRFPKGESYKDLISRLEEVVLELESISNILLLVVAHQDILCCIFGYYMGTELKELPLIDVPLHTIFKLDINGDEVEVFYQPNLVTQIENVKGK